jgi:hypothetical protein
MLTGNMAIFRLLASGVDALRDLALESNEIEAFVVAEDLQGAWSVVEEAQEQQYPVRLLKWGQFSTVKLLPAEQTEERQRRIGFR